MHEAVGEPVAVMFLSLFFLSLANNKPMKMLAHILLDNDQMRHCYRFHIVFLSLGPLSDFIGWKFSFLPNPRINLYMCRRTAFFFVCSSCIFLHSRKRSADNSATCFLCLNLIQTLSYQHKVKLNEIWWLISCIEGPTPTGWRGGGFLAN